MACTSAAASRLLMCVVFGICTISTTHGAPTAYEKQGEAWSANDTKISCPDHGGLESILTHNRSPTLLLGAGISVFADILISVSLNIQKYSHNQRDKDGNMLHDPLWWSGMIMNICGEIGNLIAYAFAPASVVAPVGAVGVFANAIFASVFLKEPFQYRDAGGLSMILFGVVLIILFAPDLEVEYSSQYMYDHILTNAQSMLYLAVVLFLIAVLLVLVKKGWGSRNVIVYVSLCALISSLTVMASKSFAGTLKLGLTPEGRHEFLSPVLYVSLLIIIITAVWSTSYLQQAMKCFGNNKVVPTYYCTFTVASVVAGALFYHEMACMSPWDFIAFCLGCLLAGIGVYIIASQAEAEDHVVTQAQELEDGCERRESDAKSTTVAPSDTDQSDRDADDPEGGTDLDGVELTVQQNPPWGLKGVGYANIFAESKWDQASKKGAGDRSSWNSTPGVQRSKTLQPAPEAYVKRSQSSL